MISSGEETGRLDYVLEKVANYYDREVETSIKGLTSMIEPILISIMGAGGREQSAWGSCCRFSSSARGIDADPNPAVN